MKILVNKLTNEIIACGTEIEPKLDELAYLIDRSYGVGINEGVDYEIFDVDKYITPIKFLYINGELKLNPKYTPPNDEIESIKLLIADLALNQGGGL